MMGGGVPTVDDPDMLTIKIPVNRVSVHTLKRTEKILKRIGHDDLAIDLWIIRKAVGAAFDELNGEE